MEQKELFDLPPAEGPSHLHTFKPLHDKIWTENKARLIERYLYYFVQITHHGTYIDGFAGPQDPDVLDAWAAKLVLESQPAWLRKFFLCELNRSKYAHLTELVNAQPEVRGREIRPYKGDFNQLLPKILSDAAIKETEASFCLLDQHTFECEWNTVRRISQEKTGNKVEIFYFFPTGWLARAISGTTKNRQTIDRWWGRKDWTALQGLRRIDQAEIMGKRFCDELGYKYVFNWPIFERGDGGTEMYHMIHATDHDEAPNLMARAYRRAVYPVEPPEQFTLELDEWRQGEQIESSNGGL